MDRTAFANGIHACLSRRKVLAVTAAATLLQGCLAAPRAAPATSVIAAPLTAQQQLSAQSAERMRQKFGRIGVELVVDAMKGEKFYCVEMFPEHGEQPFVRGSFSHNSNLKQALPIAFPERVRVVWRADGCRTEVDAKGKWLCVGDVLGDEVIEVGSRIPQSLLDDLKRDRKGNLRLKFRMSNAGTMFGWDIERRPGFDINKRDEMGEIQWVGPTFTMEGGDFMEAHPAHHVAGISRDMESGRVALSQEWLDKGYYLTGPRKDKLWKKGWYIDRKTGQKIETDF